MNAPSEWAQFRETLKIRISVPWDRPVVWFYLIFGVGLVGGLGTWDSLIKAASKGAGTQELGASVFSYALAISVTVVGDAILDKDTVGWFKFAAFMVFIGYLVLLFNSTAWLAGLTGGSKAVVVCSFLVLAPMFVLWWVLAGSDQRFAINSNPKHALGDDPMQDL